MHAYIYLKFRKYSLIAKWLCDIQGVARITINLVVQAKFSLKFTMLREMRIQDLPYSRPKHGDFNSCTEDGAKMYFPP